VDVWRRLRATLQSYGTSDVLRVQLRIGRLCAESPQHKAAEYDTQSADAMHRHTPILLTPRGVPEFLFLGFNAHVLQTHRLARVVLELDRVLLLVVGNLGRERHLAFTFAGRLDTDFDERERIVDAARLIARLPKTNPAIGGDDDLLTTVLERVSACEMQ